MLVWPGVGSADGVLLWSGVAPPSTLSGDAALSSGDTLGLGLEVGLADAVLVLSGVRSTDGVLWSGVASSSCLPFFSPSSTLSGDAAFSSGDTLGLGLGVALADAAPVSSGVGSADGVLLWSGVASSSYLPFFSSSSTLSGDAAFSSGDALGLADGVLLWSGIALYSLSFSPSLALSGDALGLGLGLANGGLF